MGNIGDIPINLSYVCPNPFNFSKIYGIVNNLGVGIPFCINVEKMDASIHINKSIINIINLPNMCFSNEMFLIDGKHRYIGSYNLNNTCRKPMEINMYADVTYGNYTKYIREIGGIGVFWEMKWSSAIKYAIISLVGSDSLGP